MRLRLSIFALALFTVACIDEPPPSAMNSTNATNAENATNSANAVNATNSVNATNASMDAGEPDMGRVADMDVPDMEGSLPSMYRTTSGLLAYYPLRTAPRSGFASDEATGTFPITLASVVDLDSDATTLNLGANAHVIASADDLIDAMQSEFTIELWVDEALRQEVTLVSVGDAFSIGLPGTGAKDVSIAIGDQAIAFPEVVLRDRSMHLVITHDGEFLRAYLDGILVGAEIFEEPLVDGTQITLGGGDTEAVISLLAFYDRALSPVEVARHHVVGTNPSSEVEVDATPDDVFARVYRSTSTVDALTSPVDTATIITDQDWRSRDQLQAGVDRAGFVRWNVASVNLPPNPTELEAYAHLKSTSFGADESTVVTAHEVLTDWNTRDISWANASADRTWSAPGGLEGTDYAEASIAELTVRQRGARESWFFDVSSLIDAWAAGENYGLTLRSDGVTAGAFAGDEFSQFPHLRPALTVMGRATRPDAPSSHGVEGASFGEGGGRLNWESAGQDDVIWFEVYVDGRLRGVTGMNFLDIEGAVPDSEYEVVTVDAFGQITR